MESLIKEVYRSCRRKINEIRVIIFTPGKDRINKPIYFFNHIPKCGGTSLLNILRNWFVIVRDYPPHDGKFPDPEELKKNMEFYITHPVDIKSFKPWQILSGHYHDSPFRLRDRYGDKLNSSRIRLIGFLRDPWEHRLSQYYYAKKRNHNYSWIKNVTLPDFMMGSYHQNYFARALECDETNYEKVLSEYFFIGIVEDYERSVSQLSKKLGRPLINKVPHLNRVERVQATEELGIALDEFKKLNELDYKIYGYVKKRIESENS